jgi:hypothetical protein
MGLQIAFLPFSFSFTFPLAFLGTRKRERGGGERERENHACKLTQNNINMGWNVNLQLSNYALYSVNYREMRFLHKTQNVYCIFSQS